MFAIQGTGYEILNKAFAYELFIIGGIEISN